MEEMLKHKNISISKKTDVFQSCLFIDAPSVIKRKKNTHTIKTNLKLRLETIKELIDKFGLERAWYSILATHIYHIQQPSFDYLLMQKEFSTVKILDFDVLDSVSIGEIATFYEYSLSYFNRDKRQEEGQYFTPDDIACLMAKKTHVFGPDKIWVDPCSGIGNLSYWLVKLQRDPERFLVHQLYLMDKDPLALFIARTLFTLSFQKKSKNLFFDLESRLIVADFLSSNNIPVFDFAILNPPYVEVSPPDKMFKTAHARNLYAYFLEKVIELSKGFVSISPQTFTHSQRFKTLRQLLLTKMKDISIYCFDNVPDTIFRGFKYGSTNTNKVNSIRASIIVAHSESQSISFRITPLLRWRCNERSDMLEHIDDYLTSIEPHPEIFPKLQKDLVFLYHEIRKSQKCLVHLVSPHPTHYKLIIPSTPRYFISALKITVNRTSFKSLYFYNQKDCDIAYLLLNSSYFYWWWRIHDGGMTISERTLLSLPVPDNIPVDTMLISKLEQSEHINRVVKKNAGKNNENVKHSIDLIYEINQKLFPQYASALIRLHNNSDLIV